MAGVFLGPEKNFLLDIKFWCFFCVLCAVISFPALFVPTDYKAKNLKKNEKSSKSVSHWKNPKNESTIITISLSILTCHSILSFSREPATFGGFYGDSNNDGERKRRRTH